MKSVVFQECFSMKGTCSSLRPTVLLKTTLWHRCFPVNFVKCFSLQLYLKWGSGTQVFSVCKFIKNKTPIQMFSWKCEVFSLQFYQKWDSCTGIFLWILRKFSACNFIINKTPAQVFLGKLHKDFGNNYFVDYLKTVDSNIWLWVDSFVTYCSLK